MASSSFKEDLSLIAIRPPPPGKNYKLRRVYGPAKQANSGSPVFQGDALVGLNEISPFDAEIDGKKVTGLGVSIPRRIRGFLVRHGYGRLIE